MGARDGATQGVAQHMIYEERCPDFYTSIRYNRSQDHILILGTHNKLNYLRSLDPRPRDALNRKNEEAAAAAAAPSSSFYHMQSNSDSHRQHQNCLEREIKKKKTERKRERECVRERENWWVLELELNCRIVKSKSKRRGFGRRRGFI